MLSTYPCKCIRVLRQKVETVTNSTACRIMAHENKQPDLPNCKSSKFWIKLLWYGFGILWEVGLQHEIDDCFASDGLGNVFVVFIPLVQEFADVLVHFAPI